MFKKIIFTCAFTLMLTTNVKSEEISSDGLMISSSLLNSYDNGLNTEFWKGYSYTAKDNIDSLSYLGKKSILYFHEKLNMSEKSIFSRLLFTLGFGIVQLRYDMANSIMLGHELVHFQNGHSIGLENHYFYDKVRSNRISNWEFYKDLLITGEINSPAVSSPIDSSNYDVSKYIEKRALHEGNSLNWQMNYSREWTKDFLFSNSKTVFDSSIYLINKLYPSIYALSDCSNRNKIKDISGDVFDYAGEFTRKNGGKHNDNLKKITQITVLSVLFSPSVYSNLFTPGEYIKKSKIKTEQPFLNTKYGKFSWDVESYYNIENVSMSPRGYLLSENNNFLNADKIMYSFGIEQAVMGKNDTELHTGLRAQWGNLMADVDLSFNSGDIFLESEMHYEFNNNFGAYGSYINSYGDTFKSDRLTPFGENVFSIGLKSRF